MKGFFINKMMVDNPGVFRQSDARRQPQCGVYLFLTLLTTIICRFDECHPPETARIEADGFVS
jgi:hypothetical protein